MSSWSIWHWLILIFAILVCTGPLRRTVQQTGIKQTFLLLKGRVDRSVFWSWLLVVFVIQYFASYWAMTTVMQSEADIEVAAGASRAVSFLIALLLFWPSLAIVVKRWHDINKSGWWTLINLVPIFGWIASIAYNGFVGGTNADNRFGSPRA